MSVSAIVAFPTLAMLPVLDVRKYGAKLDGTTDDSDTIGAAITACPDYGTVYIPATPLGTKISKRTAVTYCLNLKSKMRLIGDNTLITVTSNAAATEALMLNVSSAQDVIIQGFRFASTADQDYPSTLTVTGAVNNGSGLIRLTSTSHGLANGSSVVVRNVGGVPNASGTWVISGVAANTLDLVGSTFAGTYTSGGVISIRTGLTSNIYCIHVNQAVTNLIVSDIQADTCEAVAKVDGGDYIWIHRVKATTVRQSLFFDSTTRVLATDLNLGSPALASDDANALNHQIYINKLCSRIAVENAHITGGSGYPIQLQNTTGTSANTDLAFSNIEMSSVARGVVLNGGNQRVTFTNFTVNGFTTASYPLLNILVATNASYLTDGVVINGFSINNTGTNCSGLYNGPTGSPSSTLWPQSVLFSNGICDGEFSSNAILPQATQTLTITGVQFNDAMASGGTGAYMILANAAFGNFTFTSNRILYPSGTGAGNFQTIRCSSTGTIYATNNLILNSGSAINGWCYATSGKVVCEGNMYSGFNNLIVNASGTNGEVGRANWNLDRTNDRGDCVSFTTDADTTLSTQVASHRIIRCSGQTVNRTLTFPTAAAGQTWIIDNRSAVSILCKTAAAGTITVATARAAQIYCEGTAMSRLTADSVQT